MQEVPVLQRMPRNLWRTWGRMNFPINGLQVFLPLWHPELTGSPIISKDLNAYSCTFVGTTKGATGRTFDATDDSLTFGDTSTLAFMHGKGNTTAFKWTFLFWFNQLHPGTAPAYILFNNAGTASATGLFIYLNTSRQIKLAITRSVSLEFVIDKTTTSTYPNSTAFNCLGITYDQSLANANVKLYLAGAYLESGNKTAYAPNDANATYAPLIGNYNPSGGYFDGIMGEMVILNGVVLDAGQMAHYYNATKWRYS